MELRFRLLHRLADGAVHSGEALGQALGVTRAAVWKAMQGIEDLGVVVESVPGQGYRWCGATEPLDAAAIRSRLPAVPELRIEILQSTASTSRHCLEAAAAGADSGLVVLAEHQSGGRGRRGRSWVTPYAGQLALSILWRYESGPSRLQGLSLALGVAARRALCARGVEGVQLKWPNDLVVGRRKLGGILVDLAGEAGGPCQAVAGIGLNVSIPPTAADQIGQPWIDLVTLAPGIGSRNDLAAALIARWVDVLRAYPEHGFAHYRADWTAADALDGQPVSVLTGAGAVDGTAAGVDDSGALLVRDGAGVRRFDSGEVSLRGRPT